MPLTEPLRARVARLLTGVEVDPPSELLAPDGIEPYSISFGRQRVLLFRSQALEDLSALAHLLAQPALSHGGHARAAVRKMLERACDLMQESGLDAAIDWLESQLDQPTREYIVVQPIALVTKSTGVLELGACTLFPGLADVGLPIELPPWADREMPGKVIATQVRARDEESAKVIAQHRVDETVAILAFTDGQRRAWEPSKRTVGPVEGPFMIGTGRPTPLLSITHAQDSTGKLWPGVRALLAAAAKPDDQRTPWESRSLAAVRWYATGVRTTWPAQALTAHMTALDCLFVERRAKGKGGIIAREVTKRWVLKTHTAKQQRRWLNDLYDKRSDAVHEGRDFLEDAKLEQLSSLVHRAVGWASFHLDPMHKSVEPRACTDVSEVFVCDDERARESEGS